MPDLEEVLGISSLIGSQNQEPPSDAISSRRESVCGLAWIQNVAIFEASVCVRMLGFRAHSETESTEA